MLASAKKLFTICDSRDIVQTKQLFLIEKAMLYIHEKQFSKVTPLLYDCLDLLQKDPQPLGTYYLDVGEYFQAIGNYNGAERAYKLLRKRMNADPIMSAGFRYKGEIHLAQLYYRMREYEKSREVLTRVYPKIQKDRNCDSTTKTLAESLIPLLAQVK